MVDTILKEVSASEFKVFISGETNFRDQIYPDYKANRKGKPRPKWLYDCKEYLVKEWQAEVTEGYEADDALGIVQSAYFSDNAEFGGTPHDCIICSIDKDLLQVPGQHYNFVRKERSIVTIHQGWYNFYCSLLVGDPTDNIGGCPGIGKKKAPRILEGCETPEDMFTCVRETYNNDKLMLLNGKLLWIWRKDNDIWTHHELESVNSTAPVVEPS